MASKKYSIEIRSKNGYDTIWYSDIHDFVGYENIITIFAPDDIIDHFVAESITNDLFEMWFAADEQNTTRHLLNSHIIIKEH